MLPGWRIARLIKGMIWNHGPSIHGRRHLQYDVDRKGRSSNVHIKSRFRAWSMVMLDGRAS